MRDTVTGGKGELESEEMSDRQRKGVRGKSREREREGTNETKSRKEGQ